MKSRLCALIVGLMLMLPGSARAADASFAPDAERSIEAAAQTDWSEAVYTICDEQGNSVTSIYGRAYEGDEYIAADNRLYSIISVDDASLTAVARYVGQEDMAGLTDEAVPTIARDAKKMIAMYSTHSDESYVPTDGTESKAKNAGIYDVDAALKKALEERGIEVELDKTTHLPHDAGAYRRSRTTAARLLKQQPAALLDIHRDGIPNPDEYTQKIDGENASKVRLLVGKSNPNSAANRKFAKQIKATADKMYPDLIKDIYIGKGDYNQELAPRAILLEFGTHTIKKERAINSTEFMADVLNRVLFGSTAKAEAAPEGAGAQPNAQNGARTVENAAAETRDSGALWGILWVVGIAVAAIIIYGLVTTGSFSGMWRKIKRGASETTGGLMGRKRDRDKDGE